MAEERVRVSRHGILLLDPLIPLTHVHAPPLPPRPAIAAGEFQGSVKHSARIPNQVPDV